MIVSKFSLRDLPASMPVLSLGPIINITPYLISITQQGHFFFFSKRWGGRTSDKHITAQSGYLDCLVQNAVVLGDSK